MMMKGGTTYGGWGQLSMLANNGIGVGTGRGSTRLVEVEGHCFGVAPNVEWMLLVVGKKASPAVNMTAFLYCKMWEGIRGDLGKVDPLGGTMVGVQEMSGVDGMVETKCYRCLGSPTFFHHPALSTIPFFMKHDNQWLRDLLRDLGPVYRWWCFKHHLLKAESTASFLSHFLFISDLFISLSIWLCNALLSHHHAYALALAQLTHSPSLIIMLTLTDIAFSAVFSLCTAL